MSLLQERSSYVEDYPVLTIAQLRRAGLFHGAGTGVKLKLGHAGVRFHFDRRLGLIRAELPRKANGKPQNIVAPEVSYPRGKGRVFTCPMAGNRCTKLYLKDGVLASRQGHDLRYGSQAGPEIAWSAKVQRLVDRLHGRDGRGPARGEPRRRIITKLRELDGISGFCDAETRAVLEAAVQSSAGSLRLQRRRHQHNSTAAAYKRARAGFPHAYFSFYAEDVELYRQAAERERRKLCPISRFQGPTGIVEDYPALDLRELLLLAGDGKTIWGAGFIWTKTKAEPEIRALVVIDLHAPAGPYVAVRFQTQNEGSRWQIIDLERLGDTPKARLYMVCPVEGPFRDLLYCRGGWFACREAQRLVHRSQRSQDPWVAHRRQA